MIQERLKEIEAKKLDTGTHESLEKGACIMELVSYVAGEPWSDHPKCACPVLTEYAIRLNDQMNDEHRQLLKPLIVGLLYTKSTDAVQIARKRLILWRYVTATYPLLLDTLKLREIADKLRSYKNTPDDMADAAQFLASKKEETKKVYDAYAYASASAYANAYADAYAYADANAYADAYADAYIYAYANAYAYADAYALRAGIAEVVVETLRLAIEVKESNK